MYKDTDSLEFFDFDDFSKHGFTYPDGTGLMQLLRYDNLYIRLLHPNGTLTKFTVPTYNFTENQPQAFPLNDGYILVTQNDDNFTHGTLVDWSGQALQR